MSNRALKSSGILRSLFDEPESKPLSVSELSRQLRSAIERQFNSVWVEGEIADFNAHSSGHWYFTLRDGKSQVRAVCFQGSNCKIRFRPFSGLQIRVRGTLTVYELKGEYQLNVQSLEPVGEGARQVAFEQIRSKLEAEGLFSKSVKRILPRYPRRIAVVTSRDGAAYHDIEHILSRRAGSIDITLVPTTVQGENAGDAICEAILAADRFNRTAHANDRFDVIIVTRGGGSAEDLWAFNEETVARAIRSVLIPVISAVGHEIDTTIADLAADLRASTPSAAAELVAACEEGIDEQLRSVVTDLQRLIGRRILILRNSVQALGHSPVIVGFRNRVERAERDLAKKREALRVGTVGSLHSNQSRFGRAAAKLSPHKLSFNVGRKHSNLSDLDHRHANAAKLHINKQNADLIALMAKLDTLSPLSVLGRGFSITAKENGDIVRDARMVNPGEKLDVKLARGKIKAEVIAAEDS